jgi:hypothetical protein
VSDIKRWSEEGATTTEISMLEAVRRESPPADVCSRTLKTLGLAAATTALATPSVAAPTGALTKSGLSFLTKVLAISLVGGIVGGGLLVTRSRNAGVPSTEPRVTSTLASPPVAPPSDVTTPLTPPPHASAPVTVQGPPRPARSASVDDHLSQEVTALELARQALTVRNADAAIAILDQYEERFPRGALASEEIVLRAQALLIRGDRTGAQKLADSYSATHPDSPFARRLERLVHTAN